MELVSFGYAFVMLTLGSVSRFVQHKISRDEFLQIVGIVILATIQGFQPSRVFGVTVALLAVFVMVNIAKGIIRRGGQPV